MKSAILLLFLIATARAKTLKIEAGLHDRANTVVTVPAPDDVPENPGLKPADGKILPLQLSDDGTATFILPELAAGKTAEFALVSMGEPAPDTALAEEKGTDIALGVGKRPVADFVGKRTELPRADIPPIYLRGGYLHPLRTPTGNVVTDDYPSNHIHHHGIWTAWTSTVFQGRKPDFWNMGKGRGKVDCKEIGFSWSGPVHAGLEAENEYTDLTTGAPVVALNESWTVKAYAVSEKFHLLELVFVHRTAGDDGLKLPEFHYGGLGIRGAAAWDGLGNAEFLTSEGVTDRDEANGKPARWVAMSGAVDGAKAGIAILGHPGNFRAPQPIRIHPTEPFISFAPQMAGDMEIAHDKAYRSAYRFVTFDGAPDKQLLGRIWNDYAEPPTAAWE
ncbi:PmoA family protein [Akkermansiaceae bacterium]|nr:PmoA family protein [Akkermansiaceae bacterium]